MTNKLSKQYNYAEMSVPAQIPPEPVQDRNSGRVLIRVNPIEVNFTQIT